MSTEIDTDNSEFDALVANAEREAAVEAAINSPKPVKWETPVPVPVKSAIQRARQVKFLQAFSESGNITAACKAIGVNVTTQRRWHEDPWYAGQFKDAVAAYQDVLQEEIHNRAVKGEQVPIIGRVAVAPGMVEDRIIGYKTVKSDILLMFHSKRHIPEYRDDYKPQKEEVAQVAESPLVRITLRLDMMDNRLNVAVPTGAIDVTPERALLPESTEPQDAQ
jgi:hypothetical protein